MTRDELIGKTLGSYVIIRKLGQGGMADVYLARQQSLNRNVALKVLRSQAGDPEELLARFRRESLSVARLKHPNILNLFDAGSAGDTYYLVTDYVDGGSVVDLVTSKGPFDTGRAVSIAVQVAEALDYAHRHGLVHRDVKPANILLTSDGRPVLSDFGIVKAVFDTTPLTRKGIAIGTPEYMAPEQIQGNLVDGRADIYALGVVLYEMLTGHAPFRGTTPMATMYRQINEPPPPLRLVNPAAPDWLEPVLRKALAKDPNERYQSAGDFARALREGMAAAVYPAPPPAEHRVPPPKTPPHVTPPTPPRHAPPPTAARLSGRGLRAGVPVLLGLIAVLVVGLTVASMALFAGGSDGRATDPPPASATLPSAPDLAAAATDGVPAILPGTGGGATATLVPSPTPPPSAAAGSGVQPSATATHLPPTATLLPPTATLLPPATAAATATATATRLPATPTPSPLPAVTMAPGMIADFEDGRPWQVGAQNNGTLVASNEQAHQGARSGRLDYHFDTADNDYVVFQQPRPLDGTPRQFSTWVLGDGAGQFLNLWMQDQEGEVWSVPLGIVSHTGWSEMTGVLDAALPWPGGHISGPSDGVINYPVAFLALVLDDRPDDYTGSGTLFIDELRVSALGGAPPPAEPQSPAEPPPEYPTNTPPPADTAAPPTDTPPPPPTDTPPPPPPTDTPPPPPPPTDTPMPEAAPPTDTPVPASPA